MTPGVTAGDVLSAGDASVATNPVIVQIKQDAKPAKPRRVSMSAPCRVRIAEIRFRDDNNKPFMKRGKVTLVFARVVCSAHHW